MDPLSLAAAAGSDDQFVDPNEVEESEPALHVSVGAAEGTSGSTGDSWEALHVPVSSATSPGGLVDTTAAPGPSARATSGATGEPPPPQVMSPSLREKYLEADLQKIRREIETMKSDTANEQFALSIHSQVEGIDQQTRSIYSDVEDIRQQTVVMQDQIDYLVKKTNHQSQKSLLMLTPLSGY